MSDSDNQAYRRFIENLFDNQCIYTLESDEEEIAECGSAIFFNDYDEAEPVYCFWDSEAAARACRKDEWAQYRLVELDLNMFMGTVLLNMDEDAALAGINFDAELYGMEIDPVELLADLLDEAAVRGMQSEIEAYADLQQYRMQWEQEISGQMKLH